MAALEQHPVIHGWPNPPPLEYVGLSFFGVFPPVLIMSGDYFRRWRALRLNSIESFMRGLAHG